jgi:hypothetical protein
VGAVLAPQPGKEVITDSLSRKQSETPVSVWIIIYVCGERRDKEGGTATPRGRWRR